MAETPVAFTRSRPLAKGPVRHLFIKVILTSVLLGIGCAPRQQTPHTATQDDGGGLREIIREIERYPRGDAFRVEPLCGVPSTVGARLRPGAHSTSLTGADIQWDGSKWVTRGRETLRIPYAFDYDRVGELGFSREAVSTILRQAFDTWAAPLREPEKRFYEVDWRPRERPGPGPRVTTITFRPFIRVSWATGRHGPLLSHRDSDSFPSNVFGHATGPRGEMTTEDPEKILGGVCFNTAIRWSTDGSPGTRDIVSVAIHEIGHALGLGHSDRQDSIMFEQYTGSRQLSEEDQAMIRLLYP